MANLDQLLAHIPQRPPFLLLDGIVDETKDKVTTFKQLTGAEDWFKGHFPGNPVMPGVLMCEAVFQTGAYLMARRGEATEAGKTAVVTRIQGAKFKNMAKPGDHLIITVDFVEMLANAAFMKGKVVVDDKTIMTIEFAAAIV
ncbi:MAG: 3-hydroxyacyl-ACP dehydratase FabZ family protein [Bacteriovoracia bacterium]